MRFRLADSKQYTGYNRNPLDVQPLTHCSDETWCCGHDNTTDCCSKNLGFKLATVLPGLESLFATGSSTASSSNNSSVTNASNITISSSASSTNLNCEHHDGGLSSGGVAGLAVGLLALAAMTGGVGFNLGRRRLSEITGHDAVNDGMRPSLGMASSWWDLTSLAIFRSGKERRMEGGNGDGSQQASEICGE